MKRLASYFAITAAVWSMACNDSVLDVGAEGEPRPSGPYVCTPAGETPRPLYERPSSSIHGLKVHAGDLYFGQLDYLDNADGVPGLFRLRLADADTTELQLGFLSPLPSFGFFDDRMAFVRSPNDTTRSDSPSAAPSLVLRELTTAAEQEWTNPEGYRDFADLRSDARGLVWGALDDTTQSWAIVTSDGATAPTILDVRGAKPTLQLTDDLIFVTGKSEDGMRANLEALPREGGTPRVLATSEASSDLTWYALGVTPTEVIVREWRETTSTGRALAVPRDGGAPRVLPLPAGSDWRHAENGVLYGTALADDGTYTRDFLEVSIADGSVLRSTPLGELGFLQGIATDDCNVYFASSRESFTSAIHSLSKRTIP